MKFVVTIDTEEDNWARYSVTDNPVENIERLLPLQALCDRYGVKPTYLITYPVATNPRSVAILKQLLDTGNCEIGTHCHPWNTPPFDKDAAIRNQDTMLSNLSEKTVLNKIETLHETIVNNFGIIPVSFRAGRWGFGSAVAKALCQLNYKVDTSVCAFTDWRPYLGPDHSDFPPEMFRFGKEGVNFQKSDGKLLEVPATVGFLQKNFKMCQQYTKKFENSVGRRLRLKGILNKLNILNKVSLSPETSDSESMNSLMGVMLENKYSYLNYTFHSSSLLPGLSPFVRNENDENHFRQKLIRNFDFVLNNGFEPLTLSQMVNDQEL